MRKITTNSLVHGPWQPENPDTAWFVHGTAYTADHALISYFTRQAAGTYGVEDAPDGVPSDHREAVDRLRSQAEHHVRPAVASQDAADRPRHNYL